MYKLNVLFTLILKKRYKKIHVKYSARFVRVCNRIHYKISFKKEGLPSSECFNCFVRHLGTFFGTQ